MTSINQIDLDSLANELTAQTANAIQVGPITRYDVRLWDSPGVVYRLLAPFRGLAVLHRAAVWSVLIASPQAGVCVILYRPRIISSLYDLPWKPFVRSFLAPLAQSVLVWKRLRKIILKNHASNVRPDIYGHDWALYSLIQSTLLTLLVNQV
jgi:hypothetical protein